MKPFSYLLVLVGLSLISGCYRMGKRDVAGEGPKELPPVKLEGVLVADGDQVPVVKAPEGFVPKPIPGVTLKASRPVPYVLYTGRSN